MGSTIWKHAVPFRISMVVSTMLACTVPAEEMLPCNYHGMRKVMGKNWAALLMYFKFIFFRFHSRKILNGYYPV